MLRAHSLLAKVVDEESGFMQQAMIQSIMTGSRTGHIYIKRGGRVHQASAPGEPPAHDEGPLAASIRRRMIKPTLAEIDTQNNEYAAALEFGRADESIQPRPFFIRAIRSREMVFITRISSALGRI